MDTDTLKMLAESLSAWCSRNLDRLHHLESPSSDQKPIREIYHDINGLGILDILGHAETHSDFHAVAEVAYQLAIYSPSLSVMVIQQNMAHWILHETQTPAPNGWISLPLFDAVTEWKTQIQQYTTQTMSVINGEWRGIPLLPAAEYIILPLMPKNTLPFRLASFPLKNHATENISISKPLKTLGLRGCPQADIQFHHTLVNPENIIASGETIFESIKSLWSITEIIMMALRAGIAQSSYTAAYDYANQRHQGGKIIINHSLIKKMLADLYREKCIIDDGWRKTLESFSINKTLSTGQIGNALNSAEKLPWLTSDGIQILGGVGYMEDYFQEQRYRDAKHCEFLLGHLQARHFSLWYSELV